MLAAGAAPLPLLLLAAGTAGGTAGAPPLVVAELAWLATEPALGMEGSGVVLGGAEASSPHAPKVTTRLAARPRAVEENRCMIMCVPK